MKQKAKIYKGKRIVIGDKNYVTKNEIHVNDIPQQDGEASGGNGGGGNSTSSMEYLDLSGDSFGKEILPYFSTLAKVSKDGMVVILPTPFLMTEGYISPIAIAIDFSAKVIIEEKITIKDCLALQGLPEDQLAAIPRITEEEFYNIPLNRAFIQHIDGTLYTGDQWTAMGFSADKSNGIAIINEDANISFVISKEIIDDVPWSSIPNTLIEGVTTSTNLDEVELNTEGVKNTKLIAAADPESAAAACANYTFPNGQKGYLLAPGEASEIHKKEYSIRNLFNIIGVTFYDYILWTSVQHDASSAWYGRVGIQDTHWEPKTATLTVLPVCTLKNFKFPQNA